MMNYGYSIVLTVYTWVRPANGGGAPLPTLTTLNVLKCGCISSLCSYFLAKFRHTFFFIWGVSVGFPCNMMIGQTEVLLQVLV